jgi:hypothetical protein
VPGVAGVMKERKQKKICGMAEKEFIVAIELGSSKVTGIAGQ